MESQDFFIGAFDELIRQNKLMMAEDLVDQLIRQIDKCVLSWGIEDYEVRHFLSTLLNIIGNNHYRLGVFIANLKKYEIIPPEAIKNSERCHKIALNLYGVAPKDFIHWPLNHPMLDNVVFACFGIGRAAMIQSHFSESRFFFQLCLAYGYQSQNQQVQDWVLEAHHCVEKLESI